MNISYRTVHYAGLGFICLLILFMGAIPLIARRTFFTPFDITSKEMSEVIDLIEIKDIFDRSREDLDRFIKGKGEGGPILENMQLIIQKTDNLSQIVTEEERQYLAKIKNGAGRIRTIFLAYSEEMKVDPTGDNTSRLERIFIETTEDVSLKISQYITEHNIMDIYEAQETFRETLMKGTAAIHFTSLIGILFSILASIFMVRALRRPLKNLVEGAKKIQYGDFSFRVDVRTRDEIGELGHAFNRMAEDLGEQTRALEEEILERKSKEQALMENEEKLALAMEISGAATWELEYKEDRIIFSNHFYENLGYEKREFNDSIEEFTSKIHPDDLIRFKQDFKGEFLGNDQFIEHEYRFKSKNGKWRWFNSRARVMERDNENNPVSVIGMILDITEKRELETQLQRAQKMEAIGTLAGGVAHDLNNILSGIVSYPELLLLDLPPDSNMIKPIQTIRKSGEKATAIVQDLLTLARRGVVIQEVVNINDIISGYLKSPEFEALKSFYAELDLEIDLEKELMNIIGSPVHLHKTLMTLVSNAVEAMPTGGRIIISTKNQYIDRPVHGYENIKEGDYVVMKIQDNGIGIDHKDLNQIFEPFYTKKVMGRSGTGLGMAVVWGTVKDHKGFIDIKSNKNKGTEITCYFPVTRKETEKDFSSDSIKIYQGMGEKILVVDDVEEQREVALNILDRLGYSVDTVPSGEKAIQYIKDKPVDLIILDMIMDPGMDGLETYQRIIEIKPGQKAIIASGYSETDRVREAQMLGAGAYIKKPYSIKEIGMAVKRELDKD